jgi:hypothetical protein
MKKNYLFTTIGLSLIALFVGLFAPAIFVVAQTAPSNADGQALEIAPTIISLTADPGQTITRKIKLRDVSTNKLIVTSQINDFVAGGEVGGIPNVILERDKTNPYSIINWVSPLADLTLEPKQVKELSVTITVPTNASPGGYYGVVRFTATPPELESTGVALSASLGSLVFIKVNGDAKESLVIEEFSINKNGKTGSIFESAPLNFVERLNNTGNMFERPVSQVAITDMFGNKIAGVNLSLGSDGENILPQSIRKFEKPLDEETIGKKILFGRYRADLSVTYGDKKQVITQSIEFWVIPYTLIALGIAILVGGFITLRFAIIRYNRYIIGKSYKRRR